MNAQYATDDPPSSYRAVSKEKYLLSAPKPYAYETLAKNPAERWTAHVFSWTLQKVIRVFGPTRTDAVRLVEDQLYGAYCTSVMRNPLGYK